MKQQEGDIDLGTILILIVGSVDNAVYAREIFLVSVMIITACAKDDAANRDGKQDSLPKKSPPVTAPEWYPTPKRSGGPAGFAVKPPATPAGSQFFPDHQTTRQAPVTGAAADGTTATTQQYQWPSDQEPGKYSPWAAGQTPAPAAGEPAGYGSRRPWGNVDGVAGTKQPQQPQQVWQYPGQPAWGTGYATPPVQPWQQPGTVAPPPQGFPGYVW